MMKKAKIDGKPRKEIISGFFSENNGKSSKMVGSNKKKWQIIM
jgi:hypothetical protein